MNTYDIDDSNNIDDDTDDGVDDDDDRAPPRRGNQLLPLHGDIRHWMRGWEVTKSLQGATLKSLQISKMNITIGHEYIYMVAQSTDLLVMIVMPMMMIISGCPHITSAAGGGEGVSQKMTIADEGGRGISS